MSSLDPEEDTELRDLVANTLQSCGVLGKIKVNDKSMIYFFSRMIFKIHSSIDIRSIAITFSLGSTSIKCIPCFGWR